MQLSVVDGDSDNEIFKICYSITGLLIYFGYGINHSSENERLLSYKTMVSYSGDGSASVKEIENAADDKISKDDEDKGK